MQLTLNIDPPKQAPLDGKEILLGIMRRIGPCRAIATICAPDLPPNSYEIFHEMVKEGMLVVVGQVRYKGVVPAESVEDVYAVKDGA